MWSFSNKPQFIFTSHCNVPHPWKSLVSTFFNNLQVTNLQNHKIYINANYINLVMLWFSMIPVDLTTPLSPRGSSIDWKPRLMKQKLLVRIPLSSCAQVNKKKKKQYHLHLPALRCSEPQQNLSQISLMVPMAYLASRAKAHWQSFIWYLNKQWSKKTKIKFVFLENGIILKKKKAHFPQLFLHLLYSFSIHFLDYHISAMNLDSFTLAGSKGQI